MAVTFWGNFMMMLFDFLDYMRWQSFILEEYVVPVAAVLLVLGL